MDRRSERFTAPTVDYDRHGQPEVERFLRSTGWTEDHGRPATDLRSPLLSSIKTIVLRPAIQSSLFIPFIVHNRVDDEDDDDNDVSRMAFHGGDDDDDGDGGYYYYCGRNGAGDDDDDADVDGDGHQNNSHWNKP